MLKTLSYINIFLALIYYVSYLISSYSFAVLGILVVVTYNGVVIGSIERDRAFSRWHYGLAILNLLFASFLVIWTVNIIRSSIEHNYFGDSWLYLTISIFFIICIFWQLVLAWYGR